MEFLVLKMKKSYEVLLELIVARNSSSDVTATFVRRVIDIYYKRFTCLPPASDFKLLDLLMNNWVSQNNTKGVDFNLYSTLEDAQDGTATVDDVVDPKAWTYVSYRNRRDNYGFPFESGPTGRVYSQWNSFRRRANSQGLSVGFYSLK
eukprot:347539_1